MQQITIRTYREGLQLTVPHFFILNKGINSGKPSRSPWVNCYVVFADDESVVDYYYWLCYVIWSTKSFHYYLRGSVVEFICLRNMKACINKYYQSFSNKQVEFAQLLSLLRKMEKYEASIKSNLAVLNKNRSALMQSYLRCS